MKLVYQSTQFISYRKILIAMGKKRNEMKMGIFCKGGKHLASSRNVQKHTYVILQLDSSGQRGQRKRGWQKSHPGEKLQIYSTDKYLQIISNQTYLQKRLDKSIYKIEAFQIFSLEKSLLGTEKHWKGWRRRSRPSQVAKI